MIDGNRFCTMSLNPARFVSPRSLFRATIVSSVAALLTACAATGPAKVNDAELSSEAMFQRQLALEEQVNTRQRIENVSFRLMVAAADFCGERAGYGFGFSVADRDSFGTEMTTAAEQAYGLSDAAQILSVAAGSPAGEAGLAQGDVIAGVDGRRMPSGRDAAETVTRLLKEAGGRPVTFDVAGPDPRRVTVAPARICNYPVHVLDNEKVNAYADGGSVKITKGMLWFVEADTELAMVLAHELAHNLMGHAGTFRSMFEDKKSREADADYVGLYIMARAGFEIEKAPNFWRRIAAAFPQMIESSSSHPIMPYRFVALRKTTEEIRRMQAEGLPLVPRRVNDLAYREPVSGKPEI